MKILLTGRNGQVGWELEQSLRPLGTVLATDRSILNLQDNEAIRRVIRETSPDTIVNAAAYTAVDKAESEPQLARQINATAPGVMAEEAKRLGALLVHYSTDYVFDGEKRLPYSEDDRTNPLNVYGATKLEGETSIVESGCRYFILRTSWVYGMRGRNFLLTVLDRARKGEPLRIVGDQYGVPNWSARIAQATAKCLQKAGEGLFHLSANGVTSWYGFAQEALERSGLRVSLEQIAADEYKAIARRPHYSALDNRKLVEAFSLELSDWRADLRAALAS